MFALSDHRWLSLLLLALIHIISLDGAKLQFNISDNEVNKDEEEIYDKTNAFPEDIIDFRNKYAAKMLSYMNQSVDPCDDFYEYACGNWKNVIDDREAPSKRNNLIDIRFKLMDIVEQFLLELDIDQLAPEYSEEFLLSQKFYDNCLNAKIYPPLKSEEYVKTLKAIGGFPAIDTEWQSKNFNWLNMSAYMSNYGIEGLINEALSTEYPFGPFFKLPAIGLAIELHYDNMQRTSNAYLTNENLMIDILRIYGVEEKKIDQTIADIFKFFEAILKVFEQVNENVLQCHSFTNMSLAEDAEFYAQWQNYYKIAWMGKEFDFSDEESHEPMPCLFFYKSLNNISNEHSEAIANYLSLKFLYRMNAYELTDTKYQKDYCKRRIMRTFPFLFDQLYTKIYFDDEVRKDIKEMVKVIRDSLRNILREASWLDEETRQEALRKESSIVVHIGRSEDPELVNRLIREMRNLTFVENNYEANNLNLRKFKSFMKRYNGLHADDISNTTKPLDILVGMQPNAFYYNVENAVYVMSGILHPPIYHRAWPDSVKFGTLGYLLGHEFTHGFDTSGLSYDSEGNNRYWWSNDSFKLFNDRSNCYAEHYQKYLIPEINRFINGNLTKDENIADSGGLREALIAYHRRIKMKANLSWLLKKDEQMPGMNLSSEQLFFLSFAQLWCSSYEEAHYWEEFLNDHPIDKYRTLGAVTNNYDFAQAYDCPLGSKMNPTSDKCEMW
uniref:Peptidase M13 C-terminal domain-containing protein n=1 Tax=Glossina brevipalpis TaxID=37001 RepID=A0A1A9WSU9_9MUSC